METKILTAVTILVGLLALTSAGYISPLALSAHPIALPHVVHSPIIVKAPIATSYQSFTKVDRPALVAYSHHSPVIVKTPILPAYTTIVKPAVHYASASLPLSYHGLGYHGLGSHGLGSHGLGYHGLGYPGLGYPGYLH